jgi:hypothetical protein
MAVARHFRKAFAGLVDPDGAVVDLAADRAFEDGGVDEGRRRMGVALRETARCILDGRDRLQVGALRSWNRSGRFRR